MKEQYISALHWLEQHPELHTLISLSLLILGAWIANWVVKRILVRGLYRLLKSTSVGQDKALANSHVVSRLANIVPALILVAGIKVVPHLPVAVITVVENVCSAFIILTIALAIGGVLSLINTLYQRRPNAHLKPIKGYIQVVTIVVYAIATILMIATLIDRSPL